MKKEHGWWFPDHETHLIKWLENPKSQVVLNGRKAYQGKKQLAAQKYCKNHRVAIDIGGHVGLWSFNLGHAFNYVHAFEPMQAHRECFQQNVQMENVILHEEALGDREGFVHIESEAGSSGNAHVRDGVPGSIRMTPLDAHEIREVDFIKIDCEGYELNVLRGAEKTITMWAPVIIVEQKRDMAQRFGLPLLGAVDFLKGMGYKVAEEISGDYIMVP